MCLEDGNGNEVDEDGRAAPSWRRGAANEARPASGHVSYVSYRMLKSCVLSVKRQESRIRPSGIKHLKIYSERGADVETSYVESREARQVSEPESIGVSGSSSLRRSTVKQSTKRIRMMMRAGVTLKLAAGRRHRRALRTWRQARGGAV